MAILDVPRAFEGVPEVGTRLVLAHNPESAEECAVRELRDNALSEHRNGETAEFV